nr:unnamed protein product [Callosobruchus chinensis]
MNIAIIVKGIIHVQAFLMDLVVPLPMQPTLQEMHV